MSTVANELEPVLINSSEVYEDAPYEDGPTDQVPSVPVKSTTVKLGTMTFKEFVPSGSTTGASSASGISAAAAEFVPRSATSRSASPVVAETSPAAVDMSLAYPDALDPHLAAEQVALPEEMHAPFMAAMMASYHQQAYQQAGPRTNALRTPPASLFISDSWRREFAERHHRVAVRMQPSDPLFHEMPETVGDEHGAYHSVWPLEAKATSATSASARAWGFSHIVYKVFA